LEEEIQLNVFQFSEFNVAASPHSHNGFPTKSSKISKINFCKKLKALHMAELLISSLCAVYDARRITASRMRQSQIDAQFIKNSLIILRVINF